MSVLARNRCYILQHCHGTDPCGEVKYFAKYCRLFQQAVHFPGDIHTVLSN